MTVHNEQTIGSERSSQRAKNRWSVEKHPPKASAAITKPIDVENKILDTEQCLPQIHNVIYINIYIGIGTIANLIVIKYSSY